MPIVYHISGCRTSLLIGDYEILLKRDEVNIYVYLNEAADEYGNSDGEFNLVYSEEKNKILISRMGEPLAAKHDSGKNMNHYYIFMEKYLKNDELKKITNEYEKGNVCSRLYIEYDITVDDELLSVNIMYDDFELYDVPALDPAWFPSNLDFFKARYLQN
ncbi:MAG: hypothetical protein LBQ69_00460 [Treponema sp.]|jgi:hypothetical protein|nr:hypothetical protein [Treponema sp.]